MHFLGRCKQDFLSSGQSGLVPSAPTFLASVNSTVQQNRLNYFALMSIENEILELVNFNHKTHNFYKKSESKRSSIPICNIKIIVFLFLLAEFRKSLGASLACFFDSHIWGSRHIKDVLSFSFCIGTFGIL